MTWESAAIPGDVIDIANRRGGPVALLDVLTESFRQAQLHAPGRATFQATNMALSPEPDYVVIEGYATPGDGGGGIYRRVAAEPAHDGKVASADGAWWELQPHGAAGFTVEQFGARGDWDAASGTGTDDTAAFNAAMAAAAAKDVPFVTAGLGPYRIDGELIGQSGVCLKGFAMTGPYGRDLPMSQGSRLVRPDTAGASTVPMFRVPAHGVIDGIIFDYLETGGCPDGIISMEPSTVIVNAVIQNVAVFGTHTVPAGNTDPASACVGVNFARWGKAGDAMYMNRFANMHVQNCDIGFYFGNQFNANNISTIHTQNNYLHYLMDGQDQECLENVFTNLGLFSINLPAPEPLGFKLVRANTNAFAGVTTEMFGKLIEMDAATCANNRFAAIASNEITGSGVPAYDPASGFFNGDENYVKRLPFQTRILPHLTPDQPDHWSLARGGETSHAFWVDEGLPLCGAVGDGALVAGDANNKVLFRFPSAWAADAAGDVSLRLKIVVPGPFGSGDATAEVAFDLRYREHIAPKLTLSVEDVTLKGTVTQVSGLWFLTGAAAAKAYGIAIVLGGYGAYAPGDIAVFLDWRQRAVGTYVARPDQLAILQEIGGVDVTANDQADAIDLLTIGETSF